MGVLVAPVILGLNEHELGVVLERAKATGAVSTGYVVLTLPLEIKELFH